MYSQAQVNAALKDASLQGYGGPNAAIVIRPQQHGYCTDSMGRPVDVNGNVVSSPSEAAPAGRCNRAVVYCTNPNGQLLDAHGNVVTSTKNAAPASSGCS